VGAFWSTASSKVPVGADFAAEEKGKAAKFHNSAASNLTNSTSHCQVAADKRDAAGGGCGWRASAVGALLPSVRPLPVKDCGGRLGGMHASPRLSVSTMSTGGLRDG
jgi:hypothetical protein